MHGECELGWDKGFVAGKVGAIVVVTEVFIQTVVVRKLGLVGLGSAVGRGRIVSG